MIGRSCLDSITGMRPTESQGIDEPPGMLTPVTPQAACDCWASPSVPGSHQRANANPTSDIWGTSKQGIRSDALG